MPANYANHWKTLLAGTLGVTAVLTPQMAQAQTPQIAQASGPVTSISQLSDVQPTDWAFQALQSLVERYGCIAGYPDRTYRGNRAMTRFEFAAGMNACLDRINELIAAGLADKVSREDLAVLQRLQEEFAAELAALSGRVDVLEADVAELQSQVFNPVTKLNVQVITSLIGSGLSDDLQLQDTATGEVFTVFESDQANVTLPYRVRMNFDASFVGTDRLRIRLEAEDAEPNFFPNDPGVFYGGDNDTFELDDLRYTFEAFDVATVALGINSVGNDERFSYSNPFSTLSDAGDNGPVLSGPEGDGFGSSAVAFDLGFAEGFTFSYAYSADDAQNPGDEGFGDSGLFGGSTSNAFEVGYQAPTFGLYFQYARTSIQDGSDLGDPSDFSSLFRGPVFNPDDGTDDFFAPPLADIDGFAFAAEWEITPRVIVSGWYTFGEIDYSYNGPIPAGLVGTDPGTEDWDAWLVGFLFPDLFLEGGEAGVVIGQLAASDDAFLADDPIFLDLYYSFPVNDFITISPAAYFVFNPNGGSRVIRDSQGFSTGTALVDDPTLSVGAITAEFSF